MNSSQGDQDQVDCECGTTAKQSNHLPSTLTQFI